MTVVMVIRPRDNGDVAIYKRNLPKTVLVVVDVMTSQSIASVSRLLLLYYTLSVTVKSATHRAYSTCVEEMELGMYPNTYKLTIRSRRRVLP